MVDVDFNAHVQYARSKALSEKFEKEYHITLSKTGEIDANARILSVTPDPPAINILLQTNKGKVTWAYFQEPKNFNSQRSKSLYLVPSLSKEKILALTKKTQALVNSLNNKGGGAIVLEEGESIKGALSILDVIYDMTDEIKKRMYQFLQG